MAYVKQNFVDGVTVLKTEHLDHIEEGIAENEKKVEEEGARVKDLAEILPQCSNALIGTASGEAIVITDASPIEHEMGVKVWGKNLLNRNAAEVKSGTLSFDGNRQTFTSANGGGDLYYEIGDYKDFVGKTITVSYIFADFQGKYTSFYTFIQADGVELKKTDKYDSTTKQFKLTYTIPENATAKKLRIRQYVGYMFEKEGDYVTMENLQAEIDDTVTDYAPYVDVGAVKVKKYGKNLFKPTKGETHRGITFELLEDGTYHVFGTNDGSGDSWLDQFVTLPKGKYTGSGGPVGGSINSYYLQFYNTVTGSGRNDTGDGVEFETTAQQRITVHMAVKSGQTVDLIFKPMIEADTGDKVFEPYIEPTEYPVNADGTVEGVTSLCPVTTLMTDTQGAVIDCTYNRDLNGAFEELVNKVTALAEVVI